MPYVIQGKPLGLSAPRSAFEALNGIVVAAKKVRREIIVTKTELVARLREKKSMFADFWDAIAIDEISFEEKNCKKSKQ